MSLRIFLRAVSIATEGWANRFVPLHKRKQKTIQVHNFFIIQFLQRPVKIIGIREKDFTPVLNIEIVHQMIVVDL